MNKIAMAICILLISSQIMGIHIEKDIQWTMVFVSAAFALLARNQLNKEEKALLAANAKLKADIRKLKGE